MLYHISDIHNLKILEPKSSTHGKAYVYAIEDIVVGLLFGARKDDFDFIMSISDNGIPEIYECYKSAFQEIYEGKSCSIYKVDRLGFLSGITGWSPEWVNDHKVEVLHEVLVEDLYTRLCDEEGKGNLIVHRFQDTREYKRIISNHIVDRLIRFNVLDSNIIDNRLKKHYGSIIDILKELISGKYL